MPVEVLADPDGVALDDGGVVGTVVLGRSRPRGIRPVETGTERVEVVDVDALGGQRLEGGA